MNWEATALIFSVLGGLLGGVRWLLAVYSKQSNELETLKQRADDAAMSLLKDIIAGLKEDVVEHSTKMTTLEKQLNELFPKIRELQAQLKEFKETTKEQKEWLMGRIDKLEERTISLGKVVLKT